MAEPITVATATENGIIGRNGELPWPSIPADKRQCRNRIADRPVILGRRTFDSMREDLPGTVQIVLGRSASEYDVESVHPARGIDDAVATVESLGADRAYAIRGAGIDDPFRPVIDRMILSRIPGEYDDAAHFPEWDTDEWITVERTPYNGFTPEEWMRTDIASVP